VEFNIILPVAPGGSVDPEKMADYLKVIFASMVIEWQFKRIDLLGSKRQRAAARKAGAVMADLETMARIMGGVAEAAVAHEGDAKAWDAQWDQVLDEIAAEKPELFDPDVRAHLKMEAEHFFKTAGRRILREAKEIPLEPKLREELQRNGFGVFKIWASLLGWRDLRELRLALGDNIPLSVEYIDQKIMEYAKERGWKPPKRGSARAIP
jgi:hypothetical protein